MTGRPTNYLEALLWLVDRPLIGIELTDVTAGSGASKAYGLASMVLAATVVAVAVYRMRQTARELVKEREIAQEVLRTAVTAADLGMVFINYRRGQHHGQVKVLRRELAAHLGEDRVFMDYRSMELGVRYPDALRAGVGRCRILLAVIHPGWLEELDKPGRPKDWVHDEIVVALGSGVRIVPVYFDETPRLTADGLPDDISDLANRQSCRVRWNSDSLDTDLDTLMQDVLNMARNGPNVR